MKKNIIISFLYILISVGLYAELDENFYFSTESKDIENIINSDTLNADSNYMLNLTISKLRNNKGQVMVELKDTLENTIASVIGIIDNYQSNIVIDSIVPGKYTITYFHDENGNHKFDTNILGIPKEGYGFSNNALGKYGTPPIGDRIINMYRNQSMQLLPYYW